MITPEASEMRKEYMRNYMRRYRQENREKIAEQRKAWRSANPDKVKQYTEKYWNKRAAEVMAGGHA